MNAPASCQRRIDGGQQKAVVHHHPQHNAGNQSAHQPQQIRRGNGQHIADQQGGILGEAAPTGENHQSQRNTSGRKNTDHRVGRCGSCLLNDADQNSPDNAEDQHGRQVAAHAQHNAQADAGQGGVPQGIREESHLLIDCHGAEKPQQGGQQQDGQKCVFHKGELERFKRKKRIHDLINAFHQPSSSPSPAPKTVSNSGVLKTCSAGPWQSTVLSSSTT